MTLRIYNTLTRALEPFESIEPGHVRMYVCGVTVYDLCHVGHARMMLAFDLIYRWFQTIGWKVTYVRNITDIDDKIIRRALERNIAIRDLTGEMTVQMHADLDSLGIARPTHEPRATDHVPQMLSMIEALESKGLAYRSESGDVNYAVRRFPGYGKLSHKSLDELRAGERVAVLDGKDDPLDFVLWKAAKAGEPAEAKFESRYGAGRPGWHIECSAMACTWLGEHFDLHGGGLDLQFPHHDNEIAQSEGATGQPMANVWVHNGLLNVDHVKMSKSLGNFFTIREVLERYDGETVRYFMLRTHYRSPFNFSDASLDDARNSLRRLYTALDSVSGSTDPGAEAARSIDWNERHASAFRAAMNDDFNTPIAFSVLFDLASEINRTRSTELAQLLVGLGSTVGLLQQPPRVFLQGGSVLDVAEIEAKIAERADAKKRRDFELADRIRAELAAQGIVLKDSPAGTTWVKG